MYRAGIDVGGTKVEIRLFDAQWDEVARQRLPTPKTYQGLLESITDLVDWADGFGGGPVSVGIGSAGMLNPSSGLVTAANLPVDGQPFAQDAALRLRRRITYLNDSRALALSEAVFGAGRGRDRVLSLVIGTGIGGGVAVNGSIFPGHTQTLGEFGHIAAPAHLVARNNLPIHACGCGRVGCYETYLSGPGLERIAHHLTGVTLGAAEIGERKQGDMAGPWAVWTAIAAELLLTLTLTVDPDIIVLGGGLSRIEGVAQSLEQATRRAQIGTFPVPPVLLATGGDSSGARGAAYAAWQDLENG